MTDEKQQKTAKNVENFTNLDCCVLYQLLTAGPTFYFKIKMRGFFKFIKSCPKIALEITVI